MTGRKRARMTPRQRRFIIEYLIDLNATQAAIRAGYSNHWYGGPHHDACAQARRARRVTTHGKIVSQSLFHD